MNSFFEIIRAGINTTFQDNGRNNLYHIGIPFSGVMDKRNYVLANSLVCNAIDKSVIEFAYQGPLIKYKGDNINFVITGDVIFKIIKKESEIQGNCYENYIIEDGDQIDVISTNKSVYGYLAISGEFDLIAVVQAQNLEKLSHLLDDIGNLDGVERTTSSVILETKFNR